MQEINEDELVFYEESKEIDEKLWKIWDIVNDSKIITKILLNTSLVKELKVAYSTTQTILDSIENNKDKMEENKEVLNTNIAEEDGNLFI